MQTECMHAIFDFLAGLSVCCSVFVKWFSPFFATEYRTPGSGNHAYRFLCRLACGIRPAFNKSGKKGLA